MQCLACGATGIEEDPCPSCGAVGALAASPWPVDPELAAGRVDESPLAGPDALTRAFGGRGLGLDAGEAAPDERTPRHGSVARRPGLATFAGALSFAAAFGLLAAGAWALARATAADGTAPADGLAALPAGPQAAALGLWALSLVELAFGILLLQGRPLARWGQAAACGLGVLAAVLLAARGALWAIVPLVLSILVLAGLFAPSSAAWFEGQSARRLRPRSGNPN